MTRAGLATRLAFFVAGFGLACWAPMVPYAKDRIGASHAELGNLLLCLGLGSVLGMPAAGMMAARLGSKAVIIAGSVGSLLALPLLAMASDAFGLGAALFLFGLSLGAIDVAANIHGAEVQRRAGEPLMSGFHGLYSVGGLLGAAGMTMALSLGVDVVAGSMAASAILLLSTLVAAPRFLSTRIQSTASGSPGAGVRGGKAGWRGFSLPHRIVVLLGVLALVLFLVEGAVLDWGAVLLAEVRQVPVASAGVGYAAFALTMTAARLVGDRFVAAVGNRMTLLAGALLTGLGLLMAVGAGSVVGAVCGFAIIGLGAANIVPVLFTLAGTQPFMPADRAIAVTSILGYLGVFVGPAAIGHVAAFVGLPMAFGSLAILMALVAAMSGATVRGCQRQGRL